MIPFDATLPQPLDGMQISDFLARPHQVATGNFTVSQTRGQTILTQDITNQINANTMWNQKTAGYRYFRGTAVYRLQVNAQPFQAGRLLLHVLPLAQEYVQDNNYYTAVHNATLTEQTQHPNVELDLQETAAVLKVPYVSPTMFYNKSTNRYDHGRIYITVLSPLQSISTNSVGYTLWMHWEDIVLNGPIFGPESGLSMSSAIRQKKEKDVVQSRGLIPSLSNTLVDATTAFSKIPMLGSIPKTLGNFADAMAVFGFSKPSSDQFATPMVVAPQRTMANSDGISNADVFALQHTGTLPVCDGFGGTKVDEMSFAYLKSVPAYLDNFTFDAASASGANIYTQLIGPRWLIKESPQVQLSVTRYITSAPAFVYLSRFFKYWRGGIKVTIKFVKTAYHSGRVVVVFNASNNIINLNDSEYVLREVVDLRTTSEITLCIPYLRSTNYLTTYMNWADSPDEELINETCLGRLQVMVQNPLEAPSTVASSVDCLVYYSAAENFELTVPSNVYTNNFIPFAPGPESGLGDQHLSCKAIGSAREVEPDILHNQLCTGDPFTSIKQLLLSYRSVRVPEVTVAANGNVMLWPFALDANLDINGSNTNYGARDYLAELSSGFVLARGGVRMYFPSGNPDTVVRASLRSFEKLNTILPTFQYNDSGGSNINADSQAAEYNVWFYGGSLLPTFEKNSQWGVEVQIPHAAPVPSRLNIYTTNIPRQLWVNTSRLNISWTGSETSDTTGAVNPLHNVFRAGADDLCLAYFIGFGPFVTRISL